MNEGGKKQWTVIVMRGTFKIYLQMKKFLTKEDTTLHSVDPQYHLGQWCFIIRFPQKTRTSFMNSTQKSPKVFLLDVPWTWWRETYSWQMRKSWKTTMHHKSTSKDSNKKRIQKAEEQFRFPCASGSIRLTEDIPNRHITGCLLGEEDDGSYLAKEQKDAMEANHDFWSTSRSFIYRRHVVNRENFICASRRIISNSYKLLWCCSTHTNEFWHIERAQNLRLLEFRWWTTTIWIMDWIHEIHSSKWTSTRRTCVGRGKTDKDSKYIRSESMVENVQNIPNEKQDSTGMQNHADRHESIALLRMTENLTTTFKTQQEAWKRKWNPQCRVKRKQTPKRRHWIILCQPAKGALCRNTAGWGLMHQRRGQIKYILCSQNWCLRISKMSHKWKRQTKVQRAHCRPWIQFYESLQFWFICRYLLRKRWKFQKERRQWISNGTHFEMTSVARIQSKKQEGRNRGGTEQMAKPFIFATFMGL